MTRLARLFAWLLALGVVALPLVAVLNGWMAPQRWPLRQLQVTAEYQRVSAEQVRATVAANMGQGYFDTDPVALREALGAMPWVRQAMVRKRWPDRLEVLLVEHRARAHWGRDRLLSDEGIVFRVPGAGELQGLPRLAGPNERMDEVAALYDHARQQLAGIGLALEGASLSLRGSWSLQLKGGARIVIGRVETPEIRLARLIRVLPRVLASETRAVRRIDLRYTNGFAIAWDEPEAQGSGVASPVAAAGKELALEEATASRASVTRPVAALPTSFTNPPSRITHHGFST